MSFLISIINTIPKSLFKRSMHIIFPQSNNFVQLYLSLVSSYILKLMCLFRAISLDIRTYRKYFKLGQPSQRGTITIITSQELGLLINIFLGQWCNWQLWTTLMAIYCILNISSHMNMQQRNNLLTFMLSLILLDNHIMEPELTFSSLHFTWSLFKPIITSF